MGPKQPVSIAGIEFDALIESSENYTASVPQYPIDNGYSVSDHAALDPFELNMTLYVTATPVTWRGRHGIGEARINSVCNALKQIYFARQPITISTQDGSFSNMVVKSIEIKKSAEFGYAKEIPVSFVQVAVTSTNAVGVPSEYARAGATMAATGSAGKSTSGSADATVSGAGSSVNGGGSNSSGGSSSGSSGGSGGGTTLFNAYTGLTNYVNNTFM